MKYGDLILVTKCGCELFELGLFIKERPNNNIIYDKLFLSEHYIDNGLTRTTKVTKIDLSLNESVELKNVVVPITKDAVKELYENLIGKANTIPKYKTSETTLLEINKFERLIELLKFEINQTQKNIFYGESICGTESKSILNQNIAMKQKAKGLRKLEYRLDYIKTKELETYNNYMEHNNKRIVKLTKTRDYMLKYLSENNLGGY
ncbi:hypothetical protein [Clostridium tagluense]|uniref:Uncharacterized protein n=1 Tax=Clostridium tagluense TaxID=360422 RepID=A0A401UQC0_9CLOT|nr:hypothetical protein [Clostridium tagluense]GCD11752.1 hypothetical protein Ctaglu_33750 [Clostridium tagluense]